MIPSYTSESSETAHPGKGTVSFKPVKHARISPVAISLLALLSSLFLSGCRDHVGVNRLPSIVTYKQTDRSALNSRKPSDRALEVLHRHGLDALYRKDPEAALRQLHQVAESDERRDILYALAELNYAYSVRLESSVTPGASRHARDFALTSAVYAWLFLIGNQTHLHLDPFDRSTRDASDIYNLALAEGLKDVPGTNGAVVLASGTRHLPIGNLTIELTRSTLPAGPVAEYRFIPADELSVWGLSTRNRQSGLGAPLVAVAKKRQNERFPAYQAATALLRIDGGLKTWSANGLTARLDLYSAYETDRFEVDGRSLPLEMDTTAPLALALNGNPAWSLGLPQFFTAKQRIKTDVYPLQPYEPGLIPVVLVHGTFSTPVRWAEMWNALQADPEIRRRYQFWYFVYNSGNPVSYSAAALRDALSRRVAEVDPAGKDPALRQMIVIGHSQGGLITKLTAVNTGDKLWATLFDRPLEDLSLPPAQEDLLRRNFFFTPLPFVKSVVFIATPHRGSYVSTPIAARMAGWAVSLPREVIDVSARLVTLNFGTRTREIIDRNVPTSIRGMSPDNPWLQALAQLPVAPGVDAHSIIAIKGDDQPPEGKDGLVKYTSAHVDYAVSETIVRHKHSCLQYPGTIEEVRRILLEHAGQMPHAEGKSDP